MYMIGSFIRASGAALCAAMFAVSSPAFAAAEDAFGTWRHPDNGSLVRLYSCGGGLCAQIVKIKDASATDQNNPDPAKRSRKVQGLVIMSGAKKSGENGWSGRLYNREDGGTYSGSVTVQSKNSLRLEGCGLGGLVCKGVTWTRVGN
jgi:uncharacterized protein (DUF2147 family)